MREMLDSFGARSDLAVGDERYGVWRLDAVVDDPRRLPYSLRVLLENLLRHEDGRNVKAEDISAVADRDRAAAEVGSRELDFMPARVLMQDFTGVPAIVDLAAMRDAVVDLGGQAERVDPAIPVDLVIDHSIVVDVAGVADAFARNVAIEYSRNEERYTFLRCRAEKVLDEMTAVKTALRRAIPGDLVVCCVDDAVGVYRAAMAAAGTSRGGTAFADPGELEAPEG